MNKEEIAKRIKDCENELAELRDKLKKLEYGGKRWKPEMGDKYLALTGDAAIFHFPWDGTNEDYAALAIGNVFPTKEAAKFEVERRKVIAELSDYAEGNDAVWDGNKLHYYLEHRVFLSRTVRANKGVCVSKVAGSRFGCLYFPSEEAACAAIEAVGEERVKKYFLGVKE